MKKILLLAFANIRKTKAQTATLIILLLISSLLLNIGLMVSVSFGSYFDKTADELNTSNAYYIISEYLYHDEVENYIRSHEETVSMEKSNSILTIANLSWNGSDTSQYVLFFNRSEHRDLSRWKLINDTIPDADNPVYLPYQYKTQGGYELGDSLTLTINNSKYSFTIAGFSEDILFSSTDTAFLSLYLPAERYQILSDELDAYRSVVVFANVRENYKDIESGLLSLTETRAFSSSSDVKSTIYGTDLFTIKYSRTMMASLVSVMMIIFALIIIAVCLLVIRFRVENSIEEDMPKIGSLKAVGYTSGQISFSIVMQYSIITFGGSLIGTPFVYLAIPWIGEIFAMQTGLLWKQGFSPVINLISIGFILFIVAAVSIIAALKVRKISPVQALRGGTTTHSFKKNHIPLEHAKAPLSIVLSLKSVIQNIKQSFMIFVVMTAVAFTAVFAVTMYYNTVIDTRTFAELPGNEISSAILGYIPESNLKDDTEKFKDEILLHSDVRKAQYFDDTRIIVDGYDVYTNVMENYSSKESNTVYDGRYPVYDNEIVISGAFAKILNKGIGDTVLVGPEEKPFLITGLTQGLGNSGSTLKAHLTLSGIRKISPDFVQMQLYVYLTEGTDAAKFVDTMKENYGERLVIAIDMEKTLEQGMASYTSIISTVGKVMIIVTCFVVILVLYFVIGSTVTRKHLELGIKKAIGYTTWNLMNQITLSFVFPLVLGVVVGCLLGTAGCNPLLSVLLGSMAVMKANFIIAPVWIIVTGIVLMVMSYTASMLITWRIRKISAYALVTE